MEWTFRFAGIGGQGVVTIGTVLARAAMDAGYDPIQTTAYSAAARGGLVWSDVLISDSGIYDLTVEEPQYLIISAKKAYEANREYIDNAKVAVIDSTIADIDGDNIISHDFRKIAQDARVNPKAFSMVMLGALWKEINIFDSAYIENVIKSGKRGEANLAAFRAGMEA